MVMVSCRGCGKDVHETIAACPHCGCALIPLKDGTETSHTFSGAVKTCLQKYATFKGRASRAEYWYFYLFFFLVSLVASVLDTILEMNAFLTIAQLALLLPSLAAATRRLHDIGRSGWWQFITLTIIGIFVLLYWLAKQGVKESNQYGEPTLP